MKVIRFEVYEISEVTQDFSRVSPTGHGIINANKGDVRLAGGGDENKFIAPDSFVQGYFLPVLKDDVVVKELQERKDRTVDIFKKLKEKRIKKGKSLIFSACGDMCQVKEIIQDEKPKSKGGKGK